MAKKRLPETVERQILQEKGSAGVNAMLAARGGQSRSDVIGDRDREAASPLGHGLGAKKKHGGKSK